MTFSTISEKSSEEIIVLAHQHPNIEHSLPEPDRATEPRKMKV
jgi:hypothetical protein